MTFTHAAVWSAMLIGPSIPFDGLSLWDSLRLVATGTTLVVRGGERQVLSPPVPVDYGWPAAPAASWSNVRFMIDSVYRRVSGLIEARTAAEVGELWAFGS